jgi:hypothetical protein
MKCVLIGIGVLITLSVAVTAINILQNGLGGWDGRSVDNILGVPAENALPEDVEKLSKADVMQLFYAADTPSFARMGGEYKAKMVPVGLLSFANDYYAHHWMGPGHWEGKAFSLLEKDKGRGYNLFTVEEDADSGIVRTLKMDTYQGGSRYDEKDSFHLVYKAHNQGRNRSMRDEIRKINDNLYLGLGYVSWSLGKINPSFFLLYGEADPWVGPDEN